MIKELKGHVSKSISEKQQLGEMWVQAPVLVGFSLWVLTISTTSVPIVAESLVFGLMQLMPWYFWVGLVSVAFAGWLVIRSAHSSWHVGVCVLIVLMLYLWGTPCFVEPTARLYDPYYAGASVLKLIESGHTSPAREMYFQWPGGFFLGSAIVLVTRIPFLDLLRLYPVVNGFIFTIGFYLLSRRVLGDKQSAFACTLFALLGESFLQLHFSPQGIANSMLPIFLMAFLSRNLPFRVTSLLIFLGIVLTHPLMPFLIILIAFGMQVNSTLLHLDEEVDRHTLVLYLICSLVWLLHAASGGFTTSATILARFFAGLSRLEIVQQAFFMHPHPEVGYIRKGIFVFYMVLGLVGAAMGLKSRKKREPNSLAFKTSMLLYPAILIPVIPYASNQIDFSTRMVVFAVLGASLCFPFRAILPGLCDLKRPALGMNRPHEVLVGRLARSKSGILLVLIVSLSVLGVSTMYADESYLMSPQSTLRGAQFVASSIGTVSTKTTIFSDLSDFLFFNTALVLSENLVSASWDVPEAYSSYVIDHSDIACLRVESRVRLFYLMADTTSYPRAEDYMQNSGRFVKYFDSSTFQAFRNMSPGV